MEQKQKALELALNQIEKQYGKGSIMKLGDATAMNISSIPTGAMSLDLALGSAEFPGKDSGDIRPGVFR